LGIFQKIFLNKMWPFFNIFYFLGLCKNFLPQKSRFFKFFGFYFQGHVTFFSRFFLFLRSTMVFLPKNHYFQDFSFFIIFFPFCQGHVTFLLLFFNFFKVTWPFNFLKTTWPFLPIFIFFKVISLKITFFIFFFVSSKSHDFFYFFLPKSSLFFFKDHVIFFIFLRSRDLFILIFCFSR